MSDTTSEQNRRANASGDAGPGAESPYGRPPSGRAPEPEPVWTFRGYQMRPAEFNTAMVHYYRAEIQRSNIWRTRLDTTTNWAVIATGAAISIAFSSPDTHFGVILLDSLLVLLFLSMEARRYRYYELWAMRSRLMETDFFAAMLVPPFAPNPGWDNDLAETLLQPSFPISRWEAFGRRLRRNYLGIFAILLLALVVKLLLHPTPAESWEQFVAHAAFGPLTGEVTLLVLLIYALGLVGVALATAGLHQASGEVLPKYHIPIVDDLFAGLDQTGAAAKPSWTEALRLGKRRQQLMAMIVSADPAAVADRVMRDMKRGVTALHGKGMYMGTERDVLIVGLTVTEINELKHIIHEIDANAFMTVLPAREIVGGGFGPLED